MAPKRIIVITPDDPNDVSSWSGTRYSIYRALVDNTGGTEITYVRGALQFFSLGARAANKLLRKLGLTFDCGFSSAYAMLVGTYLTARLKFVGQGTLLFIAGSDELAYLRTKRPVIYISDGTFRVIAASYPKFRAFPKWLQVQGDRNEARSLSRADFIIYPSRWARDSAKHDYGIPDDRIFVLPFGPNIPDHSITYSPKTISVAGDIELLFISAEWGRKNGDLVLEICRLLIDRGAKVRLTIIGDTPDHVTRLPFVRSLGFLRKSAAHDLSVMCNAFREAHFLVLPTLADATPIVFSEAQAFGLPPISYDVGGVGGAISHSRTGLLLPPGAPPQLFAEEILKYSKDT
jgi:glycosyltransferase involved in cell wall biosynthesis